MENDAKVENGKKVKFYYTGKLETGEVFDSSVGKAPLEFTAVAGNIIPGLEKEMLGMKIGEKKTVRVIPHEAYGEIQPELIRKVPKGPVPEGMKIEKGTTLYLKTQDGAIPAIVVDVDNESVTLDMNHPLAGKTLIFDVEIVDIS